MVMVAVVVVVVVVVVVCSGGGMSRCLFFASLGWSVLCLSDLCCVHVVSCCSVHSEQGILQSPKAERAGAFRHGDMS